MLDGVSNVLRKGRYPEAAPRASRSPQCCVRSQNSWSLVSVAIELARATLARDAAVDAAGDSSRRRLLGVVEEDDRVAAQLRVPPSRLPGLGLGGCRRRVPRRPRPCARRPAARRQGSACAPVGAVRRSACAPATSSQAWCCPLSPTTSGSCLATRRRAMRTSSWRSTSLASDASECSPPRRATLSDRWYADRTAPAPSALRVGVLLDVRLLVPLAGSFRDVRRVHERMVAFGRPRRERRSRLRGALADRRGEAERPVARGGARHRHDGRPPPLDLGDADEPLP